MGLLLGCVFCRPWLVRHRVLPQLWAVTKPRRRVRNGTNRRQRGKMKWGRTSLTMVAFRYSAVQCCQVVYSCSTCHLPYHCCCTVWIHVCRNMRLVSHIIIACSIDDSWSWPRVVMLRFWFFSFQFDFNLIFYKKFDVNSISISIFFARKSVTQVELTLARPC